MILQNLKAAARRYAASRGVRKTTVDELAREAGISKGAFYKFYPSKEMLFFEILEDMHTEIYAAATVRGLFLTVSHRDNIGPLYLRVLDALVRGACQRLFPED